jgi:hypothetical protein
MSQIIGLEAFNYNTQMALENAKYDAVKSINLLNKKSQATKSVPKKHCRVLKTMSTNNGPYAKYDAQQKINWLQSFANQPSHVQYEVVKTCNLDLIKVLNRIMRHVEKRVLRHKDRHYERYNRLFHEYFHLFFRFLHEKTFAEKQKILLREAHSGFIGHLIHTISSIDSSIIPALLEKQRIYNF